MNQLINDLKRAGEDFEFYPTTKEMVRTIWKSVKDRTGFGDVLDIGCGTCNFQRFIAELNAERKSSGGASCADIGNYFVIEKSRILLDKLPPETIVLGTDFRSSSLLDKKCDTIFCNPPYSEYEAWMKRIILDGCAGRIFLIVPERWRDNRDIAKALSDAKANVSVLGKDDFFDAERRARSRVEILSITKDRDSAIDDAFDRWFDETYPMDHVSLSKYDEFEPERKELESELISGKNKIEIMCNGYNNAMQQLDSHFRAISSLDATVLKEIGIEKNAVKKSLKSRITGLKNLYWNAVFNNLDEITSRLTSKTRRSMEERFSGLKSVDFTAENIYALVIWVIKNANVYFESQLLDFFDDLSSSENVTPYKSNQRVFTADDWRYRYDRDLKKPSHFTLDYRVVCSDWYFLSSFSWDRDRLDEYKVKQKIYDFVAIARNLGLSDQFDIRVPRVFGEKAVVEMLYGGKWVPLFEYRCYRNNNVHVKFNIEFTKALNVEVARLRGWIRSAEEIKDEFPAVLAKGAEKYFNRHIKIGVDSVALLPHSEAEAI